MQVDYENTGNRSVNKYIQPLAVPKPIPVQPFKKGDPRNNAIYIAANAAAMALQATLASMKAQIIANKASMLADAASLYPTALMSDYVPTPIDLAPTQAAVIPVSTDGIITSDANSIPQPQPAIPPIVYALDTPENLYIDINSFTKNSDGTYTANLTFDPIVGAVSKYTYRISATV